VHQLRKSGSQRIFFPDGGPMSSGGVFKKDESK
jgi:hypothetical protein